MEFDTVIGLEVHSQLLTKSKMYCHCSADYAASEPNTFVCPICLGMPGVLPTINKQAVELTIMTALAINCTVEGQTKFDRKNYSYPDLMKGYQISQYDMPVGRNGWMNIEVNGVAKQAGITRVHLEEDVAKLVHRTNNWGESYSLIDVNRSGVPLMEIVGEPDLRSAEEARQYLIKLRSILRYLGVSTGNMEEGSFRCDANISIRPPGGRSFAKAEVKNMNSFKAVFLALSYEEKRQREVITSGGSLIQETRGWVEDKGITVSQRSKEYAHDYRYFPEPDLPPIVLDKQWVNEIRSRLVELPDQKKERYIKEYGLSDYDAALLTSSKEMAEFFESCIAVAVSDKIIDTPIKSGRAKSISNWLLGEFSRLLNLTNKDIVECAIRPRSLLRLIDMVEGGTISITTAKAVFEDMFYNGKEPEAIVTEKGLTQISDTDMLARVVEEVLQKNISAANDFRSGKQQALTFLVGQVMRTTKGRANPQVAGDLIKAVLQGKDSEK